MKDRYYIAEWRDQDGCGYDRFIVKRYIYGGNEVYYMRVGLDEEFKSDELCLVSKPFTLEFLEVLFANFQRDENGQLIEDKSIIG